MTLESFYLTIFASTKGERWVRLGASWSDAELRQGTIYPFALDLVFDYDKMISNSYFGVGHASRFDDRELYTFEPLELTAAASRGFTPALVGNATVRGIPNNRFLDRCSAVGNLEFRFPLYGDLGAVVGVDAGAVAHVPGDIPSSRWMVTPVAGLRYYLPTFVVRCDVGYSAEAVGVYFNFGQIF